MEEENLDEIIEDWKLNGYQSDESASWWSDWGYN